MNGDGHGQIANLVLDAEGVIDSVVLDSGDTVAGTRLRVIGGYAAVLADESLPPPTGEPPGPDHQRRGAGPRRQRHRRTEPGPSFSDAPNGVAAGMDAITLLQERPQDRRAAVQALREGRRPAPTREAEIVDRIIEELSVHAAIEEQVFYPACRADRAGTEDIVLESLEEHHIVKWVLSELDGMAPTDERFDAKVTVLIENVRHHVEEEQKSSSPRCATSSGRKALSELGDALARREGTRPRNPTRVRPTRRRQLVVGTVAGVVDRVGDNISGLAQGRRRGRAGPGRPAARHEEARRSRRQLRGPQAGDGVARGQRPGYRRAWCTTTKRACRARRRPRAAASGAKSVADTAATSARATATTAKRSAKATATSAKRGRQHDDQRRQEGDKVDTGPRRRRRPRRDTASAAAGRGRSRRRRQRMGRPG